MWRSSTAGGDVWLRYFLHSKGGVCGPAAPASSCNLFQCRFFSPTSHLLNQKHWSCVPLTCVLKILQGILMHGEVWEQLDLPTKRLKNKSVRQLEWLIILIRTATKDWVPFKILERNIWAPVNAQHSSKGRGINKTDSNSTAWSADNKCSKEKKHRIWSAILAGWSGKSSLRIWYLSLCLSSSESGWC